MKNEIKEYRERLGISQERLAKMLNLRRETLSRFETGKGTPNLKTALKISYLLDVEVSLIWSYDPAEEIQEKLIIKNLKPFERIPNDVFENCSISQQDTGISNLVSYENGCSGDTKNLSTLPSIVNHGGFSTSALSTSFENPIGTSAFSPDNTITNSISNQGLVENEFKKETIFNDGFVAESDHGNNMFIKNKKGGQK